MSLFVALAAAGFFSAHPGPHQAGRRRTTAVRVMRLGPHRPDHHDAVTHEIEHHDPAMAPSSEGLAGDAYRVIAPPGGAGSDRPHLQAKANAVASAGARVEPLRAAGTPHLTRTPLLLPVTVRPSLGRAPPRSL